MNLELSTNYKVTLRPLKEVLSLKSPYIYKESPDVIRYKMANGLYKNRLINEFTFMHKPLPIAVENRSMNGKTVDGIMINSISFHMDVLKVIALKIEEVKTKKLVYHQIYATKSPIML